MTERKAANRSLEEALEKDRLANLQRLLLRLLNTRFASEVSPEVVEKINNQSRLSFLERWFDEAVHVTTFADFVHILQTTTKDSEAACIDSNVLPRAQPKQSRKVAVYTGSFDPPTTYHRHVAQLVRDRGFDEVIVRPTGPRPKQTRRRTCGSHPPCGDGRSGFSRSSRSLCRSG